MKEKMSGRFYMTVCFTTTYCLIMLGVTLALIMKLVQMETYIALVGGFALVVKEIAEKYFNKKEVKDVQTDR